MYLLKSYGESSDDDASDHEQDDMAKPIVPSECKSLQLKSLNVAPHVATKQDVGGVSCVVPVNNQIMYNPKYSDLFQPEVLCTLMLCIFCIMLDLLCLCK